MTEVLDFICPEGDEFAQNYRQIKGKKMTAKPLVWDVFPGESPTLFGFSLSYITLKPIPPPCPCVHPRIGSAWCLLPCAIVPMWLCYYTAFSLQSVTVSGPFSWSLIPQLCSSSYPHFSSASPLSPHTCISRFSLPVHVVSSLLSTELNCKKVNRKLQIKAYPLSSPSFSLYSSQSLFHLTLAKLPHYSSFLLLCISRATAC